MTKYIWLGAGVCVGLAAGASIVIANETLVSRAFIALYLATLGVGVSIFTINRALSLFAPKNTNSTFLLGAQNGASLVLGCISVPAAYMGVLFFSVLVGHLN